MFAIASTSQCEIVPPNLGQYFLYVHMHMVNVHALYAVPDCARTVLLHGQDGFILVVEISNVRKDNVLETLHCKDCEIYVCVRFNVPLNI